MSASPTITTTPREIPTPRPTLAPELRPEVVEDDVRSGEEVLSGVVDVCDDVVETGDVELLGVAVGELLGVTVRAEDVAEDVAEEIVGVAPPGATIGVEDVAEEMVKVELLEESTVADEELEEIGVLIGVGESLAGRVETIFPAVSRKTPVSS